MDPSGGYQEYAFVAEFYDSVVPYAGRADVDFFVEMARESTGAVLEVGCGTGRVLIPTARAGMEIVGLDLSTRMLSICREKLALEPEAVQTRVQIVQEDMRRFESLRLQRPGGICLRGQESVGLRVRAGRRSVPLKPRRVQMLHPRHLGLTP